jgi:predicted DNA-binding protein (MmcQ/YjbR family)
MNIEEVREYTLSLLGVTEDQAFGEDNWSDVYYEEMDEALVKGLIKESYQLIASKLPKAIRAKYI